MKKALSILMTLAMLLVEVPFSALAAEPGYISYTPSASGATGAYTVNLINDGSSVRPSYWEANTDSSWVVASFAAAAEVTSLVIQLPTDWSVSYRYYIFSIEASLDGVTYSPCVAEARYTFHNNTNQNSVTVPIPAGTHAAYLRLSYRKESDTARGQIGELRIYGLPIPLTGIAIDRDNLTLPVGTTQTLTTTPTPVYASNPAVTWTSSEPSVAAVDSAGLVTAVSAGTTTVTATSVEGGFTDTCAVTVTLPSAAVTGVTLNKSETVLWAGKGETLTAVVAPPDAANKAVTWSTDAPEIVGVEDGVLTGLAAGEATVTVTTADGGFAAQCAVTVEPAPEPGPAIVNMTCGDGARAAGWSVKTNFLPGDILHSDRTYYVQSAPEFALGCDWIQTAMESRAYNNADVPICTFDVTVSTNLYLAWDSRTVATDWAWVRDMGFAATGQSVTDSNGNVFYLYKKAVRRGDHVALGQYGISNQAMYFVLLEYVTPVEAVEDPALRRYPALSGLVVHDAVNAEGWSIEEGLAVGDAAYGDGAGAFAALPQSLLGSAWIRPANASNAWNGGGALCEFAADFSGYLYLAFSQGAALPDWAAGYEATGEALSAGGAAYTLVRKYVYAGEAVALGAQNNTSPMYIPIFQTMAVSAPPKVPTVSRFAPPYHKDGWFYARQNLDVGSELYTYVIEYGKNGAANSRVVTALPEAFRGCDYLQTYTTATDGLTFYLERETEVSVTVDTRKTSLPAWLLSPAWRDTGETITAVGNTGTEYIYRIYTRTYPAGLATVAGMTGAGDNAVVIFRPANPDPVTEKNPLVPEGVDTYTPSRTYRYYASDVFNMEQDISDCAGYTTESGRAEIDWEGRGEAVPPQYLDHAAGRPVTSSGDYSATYSKDYVTNGLVDTNYWESSALPAWIAVDLGGVKAVNAVVLKVKSNWGDRTQTFSVEGSADGTDYTELVPSATYTFVRNDGNIVTVPLPAGTELSHIRLRITAVSTAEQHAQIATLQVFGDELEAPAPVDRYVALTRDGAAPAVLKRTFSDPVNHRAIFEFKIKSSERNQAMSAALTASGGAPIAALTFGTDGYLKATDGDGSVNLLPYRPDTWYTVKLVTDLERGVYDVWVNHLRMGEGLAASADSAVAALTFTAAGGGSLFLDNVYAYDDTEIYILREDFNGDAVTGALPGGAWNFVKPDEAAVADVPFASDRSLMLAAETGQNTAVYAFDPLSGLLTFETRVKPVGTELVYLPVLTDRQNRVAVSVAFYRNSFFAADGDNWVQMMDGELPWCYYPADNWYTIRVTLNTHTNRYDLYIDGALRRSGLSFAEDVDEISRAVYTVTEGNTAYIKHLDIFEGKNFGRGMYPADTVFDVKAAPYHAAGDGVTDDTAAIQAALDDAAFTGGTVLLDDGVFFSAMLQVKNDTTLFVSDSARLVGIPDRTRYPEKIACSGRINVAQVGKGFLYTEGASNVRMEGGGVIDGNGFYGYGENDPSGANRRPTIILTALSYDVTIQNLDLINSCFWTLVPMESTNMTIRNINIHSDIAPNRDGIDPSDLINATIENCYVLAADDALCFKSSAVYGCRNIDVRNMTLQSTIASGIKFGTDTYDALENLSVTDVVIKNVMHAAIGIESVDGSVVDTLHFERIDMTDVANPLFFVIGNRQREPAKDSLGKRVGYMRNITFKDVNYNSNKKAPHIQGNTNPEAVFIGLDSTHRIQNVVLENVKMTLPGGMTSVPNWPTGTGSGYPEQNAIGGRSTGWAYCLKWCDNFTFINCENTLLAADAREEIAYYSGYTAEPVVLDRPIRYVMPVGGVTAEVGTDALALLPEAAAVVIDFDKVLDVPVTWACPDYDPDTPGAYTFVGSIAAGTVDGTDRVTNPSGLTASLTVTVEEAVATADIRVSEVSDFDKGIAYIISIENMKGVMNLRIRFEVDGSMLSGEGLTVLLDAFTALDTGDGTIRWTPKGDDVWEGEFLLMYLGGEEGFTSESAEDIAKVIYSAKQLGSATMTLTEFLVTGLDEDGNGITLSSEIRTGEAATLVKEPDKVYSKYDLNKDELVDERDLAMAQRHYQVREGDPGWDAAQACDFIPDGMVDMLDLLDLYLHFTSRG